MTTPKEDGFFMPAEFAPHRGTVMIWPVRPGSWPDGALAAQRAFLAVVTAIAQGETVYLLANPEDLTAVEGRVTDCPPTPHPIHVLPIPSDDAWARDTAPTFVVDGRGGLRAIDWQFNSWGGDYDGLYLDYDQDDLVASRFASHLGVPCYDAHPFVLEGGAIHSDGEGTVMVTESCLLSPGRNPSMTREDIVVQLQAYLGAEKVLWLPRGIFNDETTEHVDNICAFVAPSVVVPQFGDEHDCLACEILTSLFPDREIVPIPARDILVGGGNIHCITQQIPQGVSSL